MRRGAVQSAALVVRSYFDTASFPSRSRRATLAHAVRGDTLPLTEF